MTWFKNEAERVYHGMDEKPEDAKAHRLVEWIQARDGSVSMRDMARGLRDYRDRADAEAALADLEERGLGSWKHESQNGDGHPEKRFVLVVTR